MEGTKVPSEARRREALRGVGLGRGTVAPRQYGGHLGACLGAMPPEKKFFCVTNCWGRPCKNCTHIITPASWDID